MAKIIPKTKQTYFILLILLLVSKLYTTEQIE